MDEQEEVSSQDSDSFSLNIPLEKLIERYNDRPFLRQLLELSSSKSKLLINKIDEFLKNGNEAFITKNYGDAVDSYGSALNIILHNPLVLSFITYNVSDVKYVFNLSRVETNCYDNIVQAINSINDCKGLPISYPVFFYLLGKAFCKLNRHRKALEYLEECENCLQLLTPFPVMHWPTTSVVIKESTREGLHEALIELTNYCVSYCIKPDAVCRFDNCIELSNHIAPSEQIYISDPDYIGYIALACEGKCSIQYHIQCWKSFKESYSNCQKIQDKDMLEHDCPTTDCVTINGEHSKINLIEVYDSNGNVKAQIKSGKNIKEKRLKKKMPKKLENLIDENPAIKVRQKTSSKKDIPKNYKMESDVVEGPASVRKMKIITSQVEFTDIVEGFVSKDSESEQQKKECEPLDNEIADVEKDTLEIKDKMATLFSAEHTFLNDLILLKMDRVVTERSNFEENMASCKHLPCYPELKTRLKQWNIYYDKLNKFKEKFNSNYEEYKKGFYHQDFDFYKVFIKEMTPKELLEKEPPSFPTHKVLEESLKLNKNCNYKNKPNSKNNNKTAEFLKVKNSESSQLPLKKKKKSAQKKDSTKQKLDTTVENKETIVENLTGDLYVTKTTNNENPTVSVASLSHLKESDCKPNMLTVNDFIDNVPTKFATCNIQSLMDSNEAASSNSVICSTPSSIDSKISFSKKGEKKEFMKVENGTYKTDNECFGDGDKGWHTVSDRQVSKEKSSVPNTSNSSRPHRNGLNRLMERLINYYPDKTSKEIFDAVKTIRERNNSSLSGLSMDEIEFRVEKLFHDKLNRKSVTLGLEKFGENAWGGNSQQKSNYRGGDSDDCVICCDVLGSDKVVLDCNHTFHDQCIRVWLKQKSVCPFCNTFIKMPDEFPAL